METFLDFLVGNRQSVSLIIKSPGNRRSRAFLVTKGELDQR